VTSPTAGAPGGQYYALDLDALTRFAKDLDEQAQSLARRSADLNGLDAVLTDRSLLGAFPEAQYFADAHRDALARIRALVDQLRELVTFADNVTVDVVGRFAASDARAAGDFGRLLTGIPASPRWGVSSP
jgi:hypothetical protein